MLRIRILSGGESTRRFEALRKAYKGGITLENAAYETALKFDDYEISPEERQNIAELSKACYFFSVDAGGGNITIAARLLSASGKKDSGKEDSGKEDFFKECKDLLKQSEGCVLEKKGLMLVPIGASNANIMEPSVYAEKWDDKTQKTQEYYGSRVQGVVDREKDLLIFSNVKDAGFNNLVSPDDGRTLQDDGRTPQPQHTSGEILGKMISHYVNVALKKTGLSGLPDDKKKKEVLLVCAHPSGGAWNNEVCAQYRKKIQEVTGIPNVIMVSEAIASAFYIGKNKEEIYEKLDKRYKETKRKQAIIVCDIGSTTIDCAVYVRGQKPLYEESSLFGGRKIDEIIYNETIGETIQNGHTAEKVLTAPADCYLNIRRKKEDYFNAKRKGEFKTIEMTFRIGDRDEITYKLDSTMMDGVLTQKTIKINNEDGTIQQHFETIIKGFINAAEEKCRENGADVGAVILTGGTARIPQFTKWLQTIVTEEIEEKHSKYKEKILVANYADDKDYQRCVSFGAGEYVANILTMASQIEDVRTKAEEIVKTTMAGEIRDQLCDKDKAFVEEIYKISKKALEEWAGKAADQSYNDLAGIISKLMADNGTKNSIQQAIVKALEDVKYTQTIEKLQEVFKEYSEKWKTGAAWETLPDIDWAKVMQQATMVNALSGQVAAMGAAIRTKYTTDFVETIECCIIGVFFVPLAVVAVVAAVIAGGLYYGWDKIRQWGMTKEEIEEREKIEESKRKAEEEQKEQEELNKKRKKKERLKILEQYNNKEKVEGCKEEIGKKLKDPMLELLAMEAEKQGFFGIPDLMEAELNKLIEQCIFK